MIPPYSHQILKQLDDYEETWVTGLAPYRSYDRGTEETLVRQFRDLVRTQDNYFSRHAFTPGHITGSALIVSHNWEKVLLTLHGKLNRWLQLGGHSEGETAAAEIAKREACEESGITALNLFPVEKFFGPGLSAPFIFDLDAHEIPSRKEEPTHWHYDVRFFFVAPLGAEVVCSEESLQLEWMSWEMAYRRCPEPAMQRQFDKASYLRAAHQNQGSVNA